MERSTEIREERFSPLTWLASSLGRIIISIIVPVFTFIVLWQGFLFLRDSGAPKLVITLVAVIWGVGGVALLYVVANWLVETLPDAWRGLLRPFVFVGPAVAILAWFLFFPTLRTLYLSLLDSDSTQFVGLQNYVFAFTDRSMLESFRNNLLWVIFGTAGCVIFGLAVAVLADRSKFETLAKALIFMPMAISFVGASVIWRFIYYYSPPGEPQIGLLNAIVTGLGGQPQAWTSLVQPWNNLFLIVIMIWLQTGFAMVIFSSAIKAIPVDVIEAARVDGATERQSFFQIIIPSIMSTIITVTTTIVIFTLKIFDVVIVMTGGQFGAHVIATQFYRKLFTNRDAGRGAAIAIVLLIAVSPVIVYNLRQVNKQEGFQMSTQAIGARAARATSTRRRKMWGSLFVNITLAIICLLWTIPTLGLFVSSFRPRDDINSSGWWTIFPHSEYTKTNTITLPRQTPLDQPIAIPDLGVTATDAQLQKGYGLPDGRQVQWESRRQRTIAVQANQVRANTNFTPENYQIVLTGQSGGGGATDTSTNFGAAFLNSVAVAVPATVIPILIAAFAAYGFAWMRFPGRKILFIIIVALLVVPLQIALVPILRDYVGLGLNGTFLAVWLAHTGFGLPLATYLLYNYISELPREILESAFMDGATPFTIFTRLILPLSVPALASFAIFQFLWVWNDYLVALIFIGATPNVQVLTMRLADMVGSRGQDWYLLTAGAFISMLLPLLVFFSLQRFFVRGLLAGSVKG